MNLDRLNAAVKRANAADRLGTNAERAAERRAALADLKAAQR
jgi:hypothetical protein